MLKGLALPVQFLNQNFKKNLDFFLLPPTRLIIEFPSKYITCHLVLLFLPAVRNIIQIYMVIINGKQKDWAFPVDFLKSNFEE